MIEIASMKNFYLPLITILVGFSACTSYSQKERFAVSGEIELDSTHTQIMHMAPRSFMDYENNGDKIVISADEKGNITYDINGDEKDEVTDADDKALVYKTLIKFAELQKN
jgi:hypothetical protein